MSRNRMVLFVQIYRVICILMIFLLPNSILAQRGYYTPKSLLIPLHDQENQLHISIGKGGGYDLNISYAFLNKVVIFHSATLDNGTKKRVGLLGDRYNIERNDYVLKSGLGYFSKVDKTLFSTIEGYLGAGLSKIDNYWYFTGNNDGEFTQARYWTCFAQLNAGKKLRKNEYALGLRVAYSKYMNANFYSNHPNNDYIKSRYENLRGVTADPAVSYSYLLKGFKVNAQAGLSVPLSYPLIRQLDFHTTNFETTVITSEEVVNLISLLGRLSVQYNLNFGE